MSGAEFHQTMMGKRFIEGTMPSIARSLERIVELLEKKLEPEAEVPAKSKSHLALGPGEM
jgi:hypothetical protein